MSEVIKEIKRKVDGEDVIDQIIVDDIVCRLGFNPTKINKMINKQIKNAA